MRGSGLCAAIAAASLLLALYPGAEAAPATGLVSVQGLDFVDQNCNRFVFSGYNTWQILETAGGSCCGGRPSVVSQFSQAVANNLTVVRMFGYGTGYNYELQTGATTYNATAWTDFDYIIAQAQQAGLKLTISLSSNWVYSPNTSGNRCWYTNLTNTASNCDDFYTDANAITLYKGWVKTIASRVNSITGATYGSDPTIFSWDLINEPRCDDPTSCSATDIQNWIATVAPYVKSQVKQLVTVGEDGFMQASNCLANLINPVTNDVGGTSWCIQTAQNFLPNHDVPGIDYAAIHLWPDNWARTDSTFGTNWLNGHNNMSQVVLQKPLVVEEFGKAFGGNSVSTGQGQTEAQQVSYYQLVYGIVQSSIVNGGAIQGIGFWRWGAAVSDDLAPFDNAATINTTSSAFQQVVLPFSQFVGKLQATKLSGCTPSPVTPATSAPASAAPASAGTTSTTGRRLFQASSPAASAANVDASVPSSICNAYPAQPASVG